MRHLQTRILQESAWQRLSATFSIGCRQRVKKRLDAENGTATDQRDPDSKRVNVSPRLVPNISTGSKINIRQSASDTGVPR
jgi:hypothetical protein